mgnify:CR=1 FL=1
MSDVKRKSWGGMASAVLCSACALWLSVGTALAQPKGEKTFQVVATDTKGVETEVHGVIFYWEEKISETAFVPHELKEVPVKRGTATVKIKFDAIKTGTDAVNQLRVVWKAPPRSNSTEAPDPNVTVFINDKQFIRFKAPPNDNRQIGIYAAANGGTFQFKNLHITE